MIGVDGQHLSTPGTQPTRRVSNSPFWLPTRRTGHREVTLCGANVPANVQSGMDVGKPPEDQEGGLDRSPRLQARVSGMQSLSSTDRLGFEENRGKRDILLYISCAAVFAGSAEDFRPLVSPILGE